MQWPVNASWRGNLITLYSKERFPVRNCVAVMLPCHHIMSLKHEAPATVANLLFVRHKESKSTLCRSHREDEEALPNALDGRGGCALGGTVHESCNKIAGQEI